MQDRLRRATLRARPATRSVRRSSTPGKSDSGPAGHQTAPVDTVRRRPIELSHLPRAPSYWYSVQGLVAAERAGQVHESEQDVGVPLVADLHPWAADEPGQRPSTTYRWRPSRPLDSMSRLAILGDDPTPAQRPPAAWVVGALVQVELGVPPTRPTGR